MLKFSVHSLPNSFIIIVFIIIVIIIALETFDSDLMFVG